MYHTFDHHRYFTYISIDAENDIFLCYEAKVPAKQKHHYIISQGKPGGPNYCALAFYHYVLQSIEYMYVYTCNHSRYYKYIYFYVFYVALIIIRKRTKI